MVWRSETWSLEGRTRMFEGRTQSKPFTWFGVLKTRSCDVMCIIVDQPLQIFSGK